MKHIPWKGIAIGCGTLAILVLVRCYVTAKRFLYYGGIYWQKLVMDDPWLYVGMAAAAICVVALLVLVDQRSKKMKEDADIDGCGQ